MRDLPLNNKACLCTLLCISFTKSQLITVEPHLHLSFRKKIFVIPNSMIIIISTTIMLLLLLIIIISIYISIYIYCHIKESHLTGSVIVHRPNYFSIIRDTNSKPLPSSEHIKLYWLYLLQIGNPCSAARGPCDSLSRDL